MVAKKQLYALLVSGRCNLSCGYCYFPPGERGEMSRETGQAVVSFIAGRPALTREIGFFGIEPLIAFERVREIASLAREVMPDIRFSLNTNGTLFSEEILDWISENGVRVALSLDGGRQRQQSNRSGSFAAIEPWLSKLTVLAPPVHVRMTAVPAAAASLDQDVREIFALGFRRLSLSADLTASWSDDALVALRSAMTDLVRWYAAALEAGRDVAIPSLESIGLGRRIPQRGLYCGAGENLLCLDCDGTIYPCWRYAGERLRPLGDVRRGLDPALVKPLAELDQGQYPACAGCAFSPACARCAWVSERFAGGLNRVAEAQCATQRIFIRAGALLANTLLQSGNRLYLERLRRRAHEGWKTGDMVMLEDREGRLYSLPAAEIQRYLITDSEG